MITEPIKQILAATRSVWDVAGSRESVRRNFQKVLSCRTGALGSEVYASATEQKVVHHTCKSRACPSCGRRATVQWQREQWAALPDVPYRGITFTMPSMLWPFFRDNRHLLHDLPALAAEVIQQWAKTEHAARIILMVVPHTFGRHLNFNPHLHVLVSRGGLVPHRSQWLDCLAWRKSLLMQKWRSAVTCYLRAAFNAGILRTQKTASQMDVIFDIEGQKWWSVDAKDFSSREHFLRYAGRYARRPPIAQYRFIEANQHRVMFRTNDHKLKREVETEYTARAFIHALADHVPDHYAHSIRHFGLLAPRTRAKLLPCLFETLRQTIRLRPKNLSWAYSIEREFGINPLRDSKGEMMIWSARLRPSLSARLSRSRVHS